MVAYDDATALVVVDVQNDFADPRGALSVDGGEAVVERANEEVAAALAGGAHVAYTQDWHPPHTPHFEQDGGIWPVHCVEETWGAALHPELRVEGPVVRKGTSGEDGYSGFTARDPQSGEETVTGLEAVLREAGASQIVVVGLASDYCVLETALDGRRMGFDVTVLRDAIAAVDVQPGDGERALASMREAGVRIE